MTTSEPTPAGGSADAAPQPPPERRSEPSRMVATAIVLLAPTPIVAAQLWVAAAGPWRQRLWPVGVAAAGVILLVIAAAYVARHKDRNQLPFFALPALTAVMATVAGGAAALRTVLSGWQLRDQLLVLYLSTYISGLALFGLACVILLAVLWRN